MHYFCYTIVSMNIPEILISVTSYLIHNPLVSESNLNFGKEVIKDVCVCVRACVRVCVYQQFVQCGCQHSLHVGTNNSSNETFQIYDKLLNLVHFVKENDPNCHVVLSSPIDRLDDGKAALTIKRLNSLSLESSLDIIDNSNIGHSFLGIHGLHLNEHGIGKLALNFVKRIRSLRNSGSAKQKLKEVHSKISSF